MVLGRRDVRERAPGGIDDPLDVLAHVGDRAPDEALHLVGPHGDIVEPGAWSGRGPGVIEPLDSVTATLAVILP